MVKHSRPCSAAAKSLLRSLQLAVVPLLLVGAAAQAEETYTPTPNFVYTLRPTTTAGTPTNPLAGFDISFVDPEAGVYTLSDSGSRAASNRSIDVLDLNNSNATGVTLKVIQPSNTGCTLPSASAPNCQFQGFVVDPNNPTASHNDISGPNGNMVVDHREIWAADGPTFAGGKPIADGSGYYTNDNCDSSVKVIDLRTQQVTDVIDTGGCFRADEVGYDPVDHVAAIANDAETDNNKPNFVTLISTKPGHKILARIYFDGTHGTPNATGGIEQPEYDPVSGLFYIATPNDGGTIANPNPTIGALGIINPRTLKPQGKVVVRNCTPNGLALGPNGDALLGCNAVEPVQVIDLRSGRVDAYIDALKGGCDEVWYDPGENHYIGACSQGGVAPGPFYFAGVIDAGNNGHRIQLDQDITTQPLPSGPPIPGKSSASASHSVAADAFTGRIFVPLGEDNPLCGAPANNGCIAAWVAPGDADDAAPGSGHGHHHHHDDD